MRAVKLGVLGLLGVTRALVCPAGSEGLVDSDGTTSCEECPLGKFRSTGGSMRCSDCKSERWTTASTGSKGPEACVCKVGYYKAPTLDESMLHRFPPVFPPALTIVDGEISYDCYECAETWRDRYGTDCTSIGIDLETIPVSPGYWRESNISRVVRHCPREEKACVGGTDSLCGESQAGPFCDLCAPGESTHPNSRHRLAAATKLADATRALSPCRLLPRWWWQWHLLPMRGRRTHHGDCGSNLLPPRASHLILLSAGACSPSPSADRAHLPFGSHSMHAGLLPLPSPHAPQGPGEASDVLRLVGLGFDPLAVFHPGHRPNPCRGELQEHHHQRPDVSK